MVKKVLVIANTLIFLALSGVTLGQDPNMVGQWMFEQSISTTIEDSSAYDFYGTLQGDVDWDVGIEALALSFGGSGYVLFEDPFPLAMNHALTITALIQPLDLSLRSGILTHGTSASPWALQLTPDGTLRFLVNWRLDQDGGVWESSLSVQTQEWAHVAVTFDGATVCFYVDGQKETIALDESVSLGQSDEPMTMGADWPGSNDFFVGLMEYVRLYNRALSSAEIQEQLPIRLQAYHPEPVLGATAVLSPILSWQSGDDAVGHQLWLGRDVNDLSLVAELDQEEASWLVAEGWIPGCHYYWRVDEVQDDGTLEPGTSWDFEVMPLTASQPDPADGTGNILPTTTLSWNPGATSSWHQVYLGTDANAVALADESWPQYMGTFYWDESVLDVSGLASGQTYYWRVDEVEYNGSLWEGDLWQFSTLIDPNIDNESLLAWWALDEGQGELVADSSGYGHHGTVEDAQWTTGRSGAALIFDSEYTLLQADDDGFPTGEDPFAVSLWIYPITQDQHVLLAWGVDDATGPKILSLEGDDLVYWYSEQEFHCEAGPLLEQWCHIILNIEEPGSCQTFLNGVDVEVTELIEEGASTIWGQSGCYLGGWPDASLGQYFDGVMDDIRIYDHILDAEEIESLFALDPCLPYSPSPTDRSTLPIEQAGVLEWSAGTHPLGLDFDVYLGSDYNDIVAADVDSLEVYLGRTDQLSLDYDPNLLEAGQVYYWRVDHRLRDGTFITGDVWRFTAIPGLVIDDFESYSEDDKIFMTWYDGYGFAEYEGNGTGSIIGLDDPPYVETEIVYSGEQSMPFRYDNKNKKYLYDYYSEATRSFATPQDWDISGATTLMIHLRGDSDNDAVDTDIIYLCLCDSDGVQTQVNYDNTLDMIEGEQWVQWEIELETLRQSGLDLQSIESVTLGIGQPDDPEKGKKGTFYVDDIEVGVP